MRSSGFRFERLKRSGLARSRRNAAAAMLRYENRALGASASNVLSWLPAYFARDPIPFGRDVVRAAEKVAPPARPWRKSVIAAPESGEVPTLATDAIGRHDLLQPLFDHRSRLWAEFLRPMAGQSAKRAGLGEADHRLRRGFDASASARLYPRHGKAGAFQQIARLVLANATGDALIRARVITEGRLSKHVVCYRAPLSDTAAVVIIEVHRRKPPIRHFLPKESQDRAAREWRPRYSTAPTTPERSATGCRIAILEIERRLYNSYKLLNYFFHYALM